MNYNKISLVVDTHSLINSSMATTVVKISTAWNNHQKICLKRTCLKRCFKDLTLGSIFLMKQIGGPTCLKAVDRPYLVKVALVEAVVNRILI